MKAFLLSILVKIKTMSVAAKVITSVATVIIVGGGTTAIIITNDPEVREGIGQFVRQETEQEIMGTEEIPFEQKEEQDENKYEGETETRQEGVAGEKVVKYKIIFNKDGNKIFREKISEEIVKEPIDKIIVIGTKKKDNNTSNSKNTTSSGANGNNNDIPWDFGKEQAYYRTQLGLCPSKQGTYNGDYERGRDLALAVGYYFDRGNTWQEYVSWVWQEYRLNNKVADNVYGISNKTIHTPHIWTTDPETGTILYGNAVNIGWLQSLGLQSLVKSISKDKISINYYMLYDTLTAVWDARGVYYYEPYTKSDLTSAERQSLDDIANQMTAYIRKLDSDFEKKCPGENGKILYDTTAR